MSANKNAQLRYRILDRCLKDFSRMYGINDLTDAVNESFLDLYGTAISTRTIRKDLTDLQDRMSFNAPIKIYRNIDNSCYYRYTDPDFELFSDNIDDEDVEKLIMLFDKFRGIPSMGWVEETITRLKTRKGLNSNADKVISFEQNTRLKGLEHLSLVVDAAVHCKCLNIEYHSYKGTDLRKTIHPYYVKQYNSRWYLLGLDNEYNNVYPLALDRMTKVSPSKVKFIRNTQYDFDEYFRDIIGVTLEEDQSVEGIHLRFTPNRFPYVVSKPLHPSQQTVSETNCEIVIRVRPNKELQQKLFSFGPDVEILSPDWMRQEFAKKILEIAKKYSALQAQCKEGV